MKSFPSPPQPSGTSATGTTAGPPRQQPLGSKDSQTSFVPFANAVYIQGFADEIRVMTSKVKPKKIVIIGSNGNAYPFLAKSETRGDLKKDKRMLELGNLVKRLLFRSDGGERKLSQVGLSFKSLKMGDFNRLTPPKQN